MRANMRPDAPVIISQNRSYRATVMIYADGGMDSANHLIPLDGCAADQPLQGYDHYALNRGPELALPRHTLLPIAVPEGTQPCTTFGLHPLLAGLKQMYDDGNAMYIANIGNLIEPMTKEQFRAKSRRIPSGLFGHNTQISQAQSVEAQNPGAKGVLARIADALTSQPDPYKTGTYSMSGNAPATRGTGVTYINYHNGISQLNQYGDLAQYYLNMSHTESDSIFADTWASSLKSTLVESRTIGMVFAQGALAGPAFPSASAVSSTKTMSLILQLDAVARMMSMRSVTENERELFFVRIGGWDTHQDTRDHVGQLTAQVDQALVAFKGEMEAQGIWDDIVIALSSDFSRTITGNGLGTDHAWGGHYPVVGGGVNGGQIVGQYWSDMSNAAPLNLGRGRMIPSMSWDAQWHGITQWMGVADEKLLEVLPNKDNFDVAMLLNRTQMFTN